MGNVLIAFSGGVDSTFLAAFAKEVLGDNVLAVTARSETYPEREYKQAVEIAKKLNIRHIVINTKELEYPHFSSNPINRCYYCKTELFTKLKEIGRKENISHIADGSNADDVNDFRPGMQALQELGIRSPLKEAGLTKDDIRILSKEMGLSTWDKPAYACLSSRFPYGKTITLPHLKMVDQAETILHDLGFQQVRVRHDDKTARIEVTPDKISDLARPEIREKIITCLKSIGYNYITLDLQGYRMGSMNEIINIK